MTNESVHTIIVCIDLLRCDLVGRAKVSSHYRGRRRIEQPLYNNSILRLSFLLCIRVRVINAVALC